MNQIDPVTIDRNAFRDVILKAGLHGEPDYTKSMCTLLIAYMQSDTYGRGMVRIILPKTLHSMGLLYFYETEDGYEYYQIPDYSLLNPITDRPVLQSAIPPPEIEAYAAWRGLAPYECYQDYYGTSYPLKDCVYPDEHVQQCMDTWNETMGEYIPIDKDLGTFKFKTAPLYFAPHKKKYLKGMMAVLVDDIKSGRIVLDRYRNKYFNHVFDNKSPCQARLIKMAKERELNEE